MKEFKVVILGEYLKIENESLNIIFDNYSSIKNIEIKKEDNGKSVILVEAKQQ